MAAAVHNGASPAWQAVFRLPPTKGSITRPRYRTERWIARKRRHARMADERDPLTAVDPLTTLDHDTAAPEMAILGLPTVRMANDDAVTTK